MGQPQVKRPRMPKVPQPRRADIMHMLKDKAVPHQVTMRMPKDITLAHPDRHPTQKEPTPEQKISRHTPKVSLR